ncbi:PepSY domain-containing protein [Paucisalibacillus sp. EB02]|uniref:PepSY domain-containing protein n=1 Tax=Paucisalibacillus sp. EB02 TaxID=1347087 RepID=UPI0006935083|nr:PepSY domain-containing protein [Paucisalibacillus sp. EB02]
MKNKLIIGVIAGGLIITGVTVTAADSNKGNEQIVSENKVISIKEVEKIVMAEVEGHIESIELEKEAGKQLYEVEVGNSEMEYDIYIDAYTGEVLSIEEESNDDDVEDAGMKQAVIANLISELQAIEIAESVVEGTVVEMELDEYDGQYGYELELKTSNGKAEVRIDAITGDVLKKQLESNKPPLQTEDVTSYSEGHKVMELIGEDTLEVQIVTDNSEKRVLLFLNKDGKEEYKSVFVKSTNRLKVIDLDEGLLFNELI